MRFELSRLRPGEWIVGVGGLVLLISVLLLPWYAINSYSPFPGPIFRVTTSVDGWHGVTHGHWLLLVTILAAVGLWVLQATRRAPALPVAFSLLTMILGGVSALWVIYRDFISQPGSLRWGAIVGLLSTLAIAYGGYRSLRQEGVREADAPREIPIVDPWAQDHS